MFATGTHKKMLIDPKYNMDEVVTAYQEARNVLINDWSILM